MSDFTKPVLGIYEPSARAYAEKIRAGTASPSEVSVSAGFMPVLLLELDSLRSEVALLLKVAEAARVASVSGAVDCRNLGPSVYGENEHDPSLCPSCALDAALSALSGRGKESK